jgi:hypothetical protein
MAGTPLVIAPAALVAPGALLQTCQAAGGAVELVGRRQQYGEVPIYVIAGSKAGQDEAQAAGVVGLALTGVSGGTARQIAAAAGPRAGEVILLLALGLAPQAFVMAPDGSAIPAAVLTAGPSMTEPWLRPVRETPEIAITWDDLAEKQQLTRKGAEPAELTLYEPGGLPFAKPPRCAYGGHLIVGPAEVCPACGVPICRDCRERAGQGCINVGCARAAPVLTRAGYV